MAPLEADLSASGSKLRTVPRTGVSSLQLNKANKDFILSTRMIIRFGNYTRTVIIQVGHGNSNTVNSNTVNSNTVNSKFHLIRIFYEVSANIFSIISCLKCTVYSNFHLIQCKTLPTNDFELTVPDL